MRRWQTIVLAALAAALAGGTARAQSSFHEVTQEVNDKLVKLFGSGGFSGVAAYGTGIIISPDGYVLTVASQMLDTSDLRVHLSDGRRHKARLLVVEPALDLALVKIETEGDFPLELPYFDVLAAAKKPVKGPGTWVLAFSNTFEIATRDEPMSVQRGVIAAYTKLTGRRGIFEAPYSGDVYVIDAITNNPGAAGGAVTTRDGELIGLIGKELRNTLTDTWINYAVPIQAKVEVEQEGKPVTVSLPEFVEKAMKGEYKPTKRDENKLAGPGGYHGIVFVPDVVERTPPYIERVAPNSPAAKAGLRPDDLVVFLDGEPVYSIKSFKEMMKKTRPGMSVQLEIRRGNTLETVELKLDNHPK
ncbi:MAG TPA: trypsin-like peptidase domain-containing protein [Gemmataceae bacterium]